MKTLCSVPAKLILSGEHAVVYQCPALSMAINLTTQCQIDFDPELPAQLTIELCDFNLTTTLSFKAYRQQARAIEQRYQQFKRTPKTLNIQQVLTQPIDLILTTLYHAEAQCTMKTGHWHIRIQSQVPIGRGLGSSAAVILSLLGSFMRQHSQRLSSEQLLVLAKKIERRQHGNSSGIDPATLLYAGLLTYQINHPIQPMTIHSSFLSAWLIDSGAPESSTGQCVMSVKQHHQHDNQLWQAFTNTTQHIALAIKQQKISDLKQYLNHNQTLLTQIGVVPPTIQSFITQLQTRYHAGAKLCGAGSLSGNHAGAILCFSEQAPFELCDTYGYTCQPITLQTQGLICETI